MAADEVRHQDPPALVVLTRVLLQARRKKADKLKHIGQPIRLGSLPLALVVRDDDVWAAENSAVLTRTSLETGATLATFKGHKGPVTCLAFHGDVVITGSWDQTIRVWDANTQRLLSTKKAHSDFVKCLLVIPSLKILASGGSDKIIRFWDISDHNWPSSPLKLLGSISAHTRPISCLAADENSFACTRLFTADSLGAIKAWRLDRQYGVSANCKGIFEADLPGHTTGVNDMWHGAGMLWTASTDGTVQLHAYPLPLRPLNSVPVLAHPAPVKCLLPLPAAMGESYVLSGAGDAIRTYDFSSLEEPEFLSEFDAHANDVTSLAYWHRSVPGKRQPEAWIVSASMDGTVRRWRLAELVSPKAKTQGYRIPTPPPPMPAAPAVVLTAEEERELEDLMDSEDSSSEGSGGSPEPEDFGSRRPSPPPVSSNGSSAEALAAPAAIVA
ncbi:WD40 repeat-like protein [Exidia glandulosa HHB12029]|uniref:WD40 repeat-like protein n=1 Tax=Exidia glandulosa HHB12029 TaxID=1314781 RepID=A0A165DQ81_EXIGL|nr:WD40 repeat-like protein [Exidia glandulosa HHB12029]